MIIDIDSTMMVALASPTIAVVAGWYLTHRSASRAADTAAFAARETVELKAAIARALAEATTLGISTAKTLDVIQVRVNGHVDALNDNLRAAIQVIANFEGRLARPLQKIDEKPNRDP